MAEVQIVSTIDAVPADAWNDLSFTGIERHAYLRAVERSGMAGFAWRYLLVREDDRLLAAAPAFIADFALDTMTGADHPHLTTALRRLFPRLMKPRIAALGSPCTEMLDIGFAPELDVDRRRAAATALLDGLDRLSRESGASLVAIKDLGGENSLLVKSLLVARGGSTISSLPGASLPIDFATVDEYLLRLSSGTRRDMRRKLRSRSEIRIERVNDLTPVIDRIMALYRQTRDRAEMVFEELTAGYFTGTLREMPGRSFVTLYWHGDDLIAANLMLEDDGILLDKYFCMDAERGRALNLYYISWFDNLEYCLERHLVRYQAGQSAYDDKVRLGCRLEPTTIWFRHRNALVNGILARALPRLALDVPLERTA